MHKKSTNSHQTDKMLLSQREKDCVDCLLQGKTAQETAEYLNLSKRTVEDYLTGMKLKFHCKNKIELAIKLTISHYTKIIKNSKNN